MIILDELQSSHLQTLELDNFAVSHVLGTLSHHIEPLSRIYLGHNFSQRGKKKSITTTILTSIVIWCSKLILGSNVSLGNIASDETIYSIMAFIVKKNLNFYFLFLIINILFKQMVYYAFHMQ